MPDLVAFISPLPPLSDRIGPWGSHAEPGDTDSAHCQGCFFPCNCSTKSFIHVILHNTQSAAKAYWFSNTKSLEGDDKSRHVCARLFWYLFGCYCSAQRGIKKYGSSKWQLNFKSKPFGRCLIWFIQTSFLA